MIRNAVNCTRTILYAPFLIVYLFLACSKDDKVDEAAGKMQQFVVGISDYVKNLDPGFIIIPQNGIELAFENTDPAEGIKADYLAAVDGLGVEELFYDGSLAVDEERLDMLRELKTYKKILVSDYVSQDSDISDDFTRNLEEGFICFPRDHDNYYYSYIPDSIVNENSSDISLLNDAENYLYLISTDRFVSKQDMLASLLATDYDLLLIDLFYEDTALTASELAQLKMKSNGARRLVISYLNIGSAENYRYYWKDGWGLHHPSWIKKKYEGYPDEYWVEFWEKEWQEIIFGTENSYLKKIMDAGFDGAYLDNTEAYYFLYNKD